MPRPDFGKTTEEVAREVLEPVGFRPTRHEESGYAPAFSFLKPWKEGLTAAIGVYAAVGRRGFRVELGVIPEDGDFYSASPFFDMGPWRTAGLRTALNRCVDMSRPDAPALDGDFFPYQDRETLRDQLRRALRLALDHGPAIWEKLGGRLVEAKRGRP